MADFVPIPTNVDEASAMVLTGIAWLKTHAPERLSGKALDIALCRFIMMVSQTGFEPARFLGHRF